MATLIKIKYSNQKDHLPSVMKAVMAYCMQPQKTHTNERAWTVSGVGCNPKTAYQEFMANKSVWQKNDGLCFRHYVQSFSPDEEITPDKALEIGLEFANRAWKGYGVIVATHIDREHIHNHFIIDTVNIDNGKKLHEDRKNIERLRKINDEICLKHGLSVLSPFENGLIKSIGTREYRSGSKRESWKFRLRAAINYAMKNSGNREEFISQMKRLGYGVRWEDNRKHITYTCYREPKFKDGKYRKCRDNKLSDEKYLKENIENEFKIRQEILAGRNDSDARNQTDRGSSDTANQSRGMGASGYSDRRYGSSFAKNEQGAQGYVHDESGAYYENGEAHKGSKQDDNRESKTGWEHEREAYFDGREARKERERTMDTSSSVKHVAPSAGIALLPFAGLFALTSDNSNKTPEEIEADERAKRTENNLAALDYASSKLLELVESSSDNPDNSEVFDMKM
jgi:hypothetical protein